MATYYRCVTIAGVGLIGGSIGLAMRQRFPGVKVIGYGSRPTTLVEAKRLGAITEITTDIGEATAESELIIACAPVDYIVTQIKQLALASRSGTLLTDAGSTKLGIVQELDEAKRSAPWPAGVDFIGSHPIAGNEKKGAQHARADLFVGRTVVVTPVPTSDLANLRRLEDFWAALGARVVQLSPADHDQALAITSHLPHLVAAAIAGTTPEHRVALTAGGWRDTTRIASGDPGLWRQILFANRENVLAALEQFRGALEAWHAALESQNATELERLLGEAKRIRDSAEN